MLLCDNFIYTSDMQFGFKHNHFTVLCSLIYKEAVSNYLQNGRNVYSCLLNASKAFDCIHLGKLFAILSERNVPLCFIRLILDAYTRQQCCCCLPTPFDPSDHPTFGTTASLTLHLTSRSITPAGSVHKSNGDSVVCMWVQLKRWCVWVLQRVHSGDGFGLFILSWARVQRVRRGSISSERLMCGGGMHSILLLPLVARCLDTIDVYGACFLCLL